MKKLSFTWGNDIWRGLTRSGRQKLQAAVNLLKFKQRLVGRESVQYQEYFPIERAYFKQRLLSKKRKQKMRIKILFIVLFVSTVSLLLYNMAFNLKPVSDRNGISADVMSDVQVK